MPTNPAPALVAANSLHNAGIDGRGVTVAVLDTGLWRRPGTQFTPAGRNRLLAQFDVFDGAFLESWFRIWATYYSQDGFDQAPSYNEDIEDWNGHGTHVT
ncbi:MAG: hypothetical protein R3305_05095, partial [Gammaproteobacteria bacterium]|nr:hypothetical protein [Gammaproteobacteria bacterium]